MPQRSMQAELRWREVMQTSSSSAFCVIYFMKSFHSSIKWKQKLFMTYHYALYYKLVRVHVFKCMYNLCIPMCTYTILISSTGMRIILEVEDRLKLQM